MIKNYLKTALRNIWKRRLFSLLNVTGLAVGISAALIIFLLVTFDFSFDNHHKDNERIYRVVTGGYMGDEVYKTSGVPLPMIDVLGHSVTGVEAAAPLITRSSNLKVYSNYISTNPVYYRQNAKLAYTDSNYFKLFSYEWVAGQPQNILGKPFQTVLTQERAEAYFPHVRIIDIIGKQLFYDDTLIATVTGIVKPAKGNTDFTFKEFLSVSSLSATPALKSRMNWENWNGISSSEQLIVKLLPHVEAVKIEKLLSDILVKGTKQDSSIHKSASFLQPLSDIHFNTAYGNFDQHQADKSTLYGLIIVAVFLLLLGCINFVNLSTAQAAERAKEIGIRKSAGARRFQLVLQVFTETIILASVAAILSFFIAPFIINIFRDFIPGDITSAQLFSKKTYSFIVVLTLAVALLSGLYPSLVLSGYQPAQVLKGQMVHANGGKQNQYFRQVLIVAQFCIAQFFIMATLLVMQQIHFSLNKDLGFKKDAIVFVALPHKNIKEGTNILLLNQIQKLASIERAALGSFPPSSTGYSSASMEYKQGQTDVTINTLQKDGDSNYFPLYHLKLIAGRLPTPAENIREYVINETGAKQLGFNHPEDAVDKIVNPDFDTKEIIVGVMADFHTSSFHELIKPVVLRYEKNGNVLQFAFSKTAGGTAEWQRILAAIEKTWKELYPGEPFNYQFLDDSIAALYKRETDTALLMKWSSGVAVFISCLGLLGLVIFTAAQRTKEIGIRKVLGSSVLQVVQLLSKDFIKLVLLAFIIAAPFAWYCMHTWLQNFAYRINISLWVFAATGFGAVCLAVLTISYQTFKIALMNPVKSLKNE